MPENPVAPETPSAPAPQPQPATPGPSAALDPLKTPPEEARELEALIAAGQRATGTVGALTLVGVLLLAAVFLYYRHLDYTRDNGSFLLFPTYLDWLLENQTRRDRETYVTRQTASEVPQWPLAVYGKLRGDLYLVAGLMLALALVFTHMERAKGQRGQLLVYRSAAREIEKLKLRVRELERKSGVAEAAPPAEKAESEPKA